MTATTRADSRSLPPPGRSQPGRAAAQPVARTRLTLVPAQPGVPHRAEEVVPVDIGQLAPVVRRPGLGTYLLQLWQRRHFIWADARARMSSETRQLLLGQVWLVLNPVLDAGVYMVIFGLLFGSNRGIEDFLGYLVIGVFMFGFTTGTINIGSRSIISGRAVVRSFSFPRAALPVATVVRQVLRFVPTLAAMLVLVLLIPPGARVSWRWVLFPGVLALQVTLVTGLVLLTARLVTRVPDLTKVIAVLTRFWMYGSAVMFSYKRFALHPRVLHAVEANPMFLVLDMSRDCLLYAATPTLRSWLVLGAWAAVALVGGLVFFWRAEESYGAL